jgi:hypothetical protein
MVVVRAARKRRIGSVFESGTCMASINAVSHSIGLS